jgi:hypothetical protein
VHCNLHAAKRKDLTQIGLQLEGQGQKRMELDRWLKVNMDCHKIVLLRARITANRILFGKTIQIYAIQNTLQSQLAPWACDLFGPGAEWHHIYSENFWCIFLFHLVSCLPLSSLCHPTSHLCNTSFSAFYILTRCNLRLLLMCRLLLRHSRDVHPTWV